MLVHEIQSSPTSLLSKLFISMTNPGYPFHLLFICTNRVRIYKMAGYRFVEIEIELFVHISLA